MTLDFKRTAVLDLSRHLDARLETLLHDFMDRCAVLEIDYEHATMLALTVIGHYATLAAIGVHATEEEFLLFCRHQYLHGIQLRLIDNEKCNQEKV
jgi:hypothetical protein